MMIILTKNLIEDVADTIAVLGAETPVTHPQGEVAKILKNYIQNAFIIHSKGHRIYQLSGSIGIPAVTINF